MIRISNKGFSLLEVIVSLGIMTFIGVAGMKALETIKKGDMSLDRQIERDSVTTKIQRILSSQANCKSIFRDSGGVGVVPNSTTEFTELSYIIDRGGSQQKIDLYVKDESYGRFKVINMTSKLINRRIVELVFEFEDLLVKKKEGVALNNRILERVNVHVKLDQNDKVISCESAANLVVSELVEKTCSGPGSYIEPDGSCFHVGVDISKNCVDGKIMKDLEYDSNQGVYYPVCRKLTANDFITNISPNVGSISTAPLGVNCPIQNIYIENQLDIKYKLKCNTGSTTTTTTTTCSTEGVVCGTGCCSGLTCNNTTNLCELASTTSPQIPPQVDRVCSLTMPDMEPLHPTYALLDEFAGTPTSCFGQGDDMEDVKIDCAWNASPSDSFSYCRPKYNWATNTGDLRDSTHQTYKAWCDFVNSEVIEDVAVMPEGAAKDQAMALSEQNCVNTISYDSQFIDKGLFSVARCGGTANQAFQVVENETLAARVLCACLPIFSGANPNLNSANNNPNASPKHYTNGVACVNTVQQCEDIGGCLRNITTNKTIDGNVTLSSDKSTCISNEHNMIDGSSPQAYRCCAPDGNTINGDPTLECCSKTGTSDGSSNGICMWPIIKKMSFQNIKGQAQIIVLLVLVAIAGASYTFMGKTGNRQADVDSMSARHYLKQLNNRILVRLSHEPYCTQAFGGNSQTKTYSDLSVQLDSGETDQLLSTATTWKYRSGIKVKSIETKVIDAESTRLEITYLMPNSNNTDGREITRKIILKSEVNSTSEITNCIANDMNIVSDAVENLCKGPGAYINSDGSCVLTGSFARNCPAGQISKDFKYENGIYEPKCEALNSQSLTHLFMYDSKVGVNCETKNLYLNNLGGRFRLSCMPGTQVACSSEGSSCNPCCADGLSCNLDTNLCEAGGAPSCVSAGEDCTLSSTSCCTGLSCNSSTNRCEIPLANSCVQGASCSLSNPCAGGGACSGITNENQCSPTFQYAKCVPQITTNVAQCGCHSNFTESECSDDVHCEWLTPGGAATTAWCEGVNNCTDPFPNCGPHFENLCNETPASNTGTCSCPANGICSGTYMEADTTCMGLTSSECHAENHCVYSYITNTCGAQIGYHTPTEQSCSNQNGTSEHQCEFSRLGCTWQP